MTTYPLWMITIAPQDFNRPIDFDVDSDIDPDPDFDVDSDVDPDPETLMLTLTVTQTLTLKILKECFWLVVKYLEQGSPLGNQYPYSSLNSINWQWLTNGNVTWLWTWIMILKFIIVYYFEITWSFICMSNCVTPSAILIFESDLNICWKFQYA